MALTGTKLTTRRIQALAAILPANKLSRFALTFLGLSNREYENAENMVVTTIYDWSYNVLDSWMSRQRTKPKVSVLRKLLQEAMKDRVVSGDAYDVTSRWNEEDILTSQMLSELARMFREEELKDFAVVGLELTFREVESFMRPRGDDLLAKQQGVIRSWIHKSGAGATLQAFCEILQTAQNQDGMFDVDISDMQQKLSTEEYDEDEGTLNVHLLPTQAVIAEMFKCLVAKYKRSCNYMKPIIWSEADDALLNIDEFFISLRTSEYNPLSRRGKELDLSDYSHPNSTHLSLEKLLTRTTTQGTMAERILMESEAGGGKSTLCDKLAWDWSHQKPDIERLATFRLLLYIKVSEFREDDDVVDYVRRVLCGGNKTLSTTNVEAAMHLISAELLFVVDGFDERTGKLPGLMALLEGEVFVGSTILMTSRYGNVGSTRACFEVFVEICRLSHRDVGEFISKFQAVSSINLKGFVTTRSYSFLTTPLFLALYCYIAPNEEVMETTFSQTLFLNQLHLELKSKVQKKHNYSQEAINKVMFSIESSAYHAMKNNKSYYHADFDVCISQLGYVAVSKKASLSGDICVYTFTHRLLQEFLAALFITSTDNRQNIESMIELTLSLPDMRDGSRAQTSMVPVFVCGLLAGQGYDLDQYLCDVLPDVEDNQEDTSAGHVGHGRHLILSCLAECENVSLTKLMQSGKISRKLQITTPLCSHTCMTGVKVLHTKSTDSLDLFVSIIDQITVDIDLLREIVLTTPNNTLALYDDKQLQELFDSDDGIYRDRNVHRLNFFRCNTEALEKYETTHHLTPAMMQISDCSDSNVHTLAQRFSSPSLSKLILYNCTIDAGQYSTIYTELCHTLVTSAQQLQELHVLNVTVTHPEKFGDKLVANIGRHFRNMFMISSQMQVMQKMSLSKVLVSGTTPALCSLLLSRCEVQAQFGINNITFTKEQFYSFLQSLDMSAAGEVQLVDIRSEALSDRNCQPTTGTEATFIDRLTTSETCPYLTSLFLHHHIVTCALSIRNITCTARQLDTMMLSTAKHGRTVKQVELINMHLQDQATRSSASGVQRQDYTLSTEEVLFKSTDTQLAILLLPFCCTSKVLLKELTFDEESLNEMLALLPTLSLKTLDLYTVYIKGHLEEGTLRNDTSDKPSDSLSCDTVQLHDVPAAVVTALVSVCSVSSLISISGRSYTTDQLQTIIACLNGCTAERVEFINFHLEKDVCVEDNVTETETASSSTEIEGDVGTNLALDQILFSCTSASVVSAVMSGCMTSSVVTIRDLTCDMIHLHDIITSFADVTTQRVEFVNLNVDDQQYSTKTLNTPTTFEVMLFKHTSLSVTRLVLLQSTITSELHIRDTSCQLQDFSKLMTSLRQSVFKKIVLHNIGSTHDAVHSYREEEKEAENVDNQDHTRTSAVVDQLVCDHVTPVVIPEVLRCCVVQKDLSVRNTSWTPQQLHDVLSVCAGTTIQMVSFFRFKINGSVEPRTAMNGAHLHVNNLMLQTIDLHLLTWLLPRVKVTSLMFIRDVICTKLDLVVLADAMKEFQTKMMQMINVKVHRSVKLPVPNIDTQRTTIQQLLLKNTSVSMVAAVCCHCRVSDRLLICNVICSRDELGVLVRALEGLVISKLELDNVRLHEAEGENSNSSVNMLSNHNTTDQKPKITSLHVQNCSTDVLLMLLQAFDVSFKDITITHIKLTNTDITILMSCIEKYELIENICIYKVFGTNTHLLYALCANPRIQTLPMFRADVATVDEISAFLHVLKAASELRTLWLYNDAIDDDTRCTLDSMICGGLVSFGMKLSCVRTFGVDPEVMVDTITTLSAEHCQTLRWNNVEMRDVKSKPIPGNWQQKIQDMIETCTLCV